MKRYVPWLIALLLVAGAAAGIVQYQKSQRVPLVEFKTTKIDRRAVVGRVTASGTVAATVTVQVGTQVSGRVQTLLVDFNSTVKKGQLVAKIDPQLFQASVEQAHANFASAQASLGRAK